MWCITLSRFTDQNFYVEIFKVEKLTQKNFLIEPIVHYLLINKPKYFGIFFRFSKIN